MNASLPRAIVAATPSPYPASFDGSTLRFQLALFALMSIAIVGGMVMGWMASEAVKGRKDAYPWEPLFVIRMIFMLCGFGCLIRAGPEAAMMITWRENVDVTAFILVFKRWCDAFAFWPVMMWMGLLYVYYPSICMGLVRVAHMEAHDAIEAGLPTRPIAIRRRRYRVLKLAKVIGLVYIISALIAVGKQW